MYPRKPYYSKEENLSKFYALNLLLGGSFRHKLWTFDIRKTMIFYWAPIINGFHGDATGSVYWRLDETSSAFDPLFKDIMAYKLIIKIIRVEKFNKNMITYNKGQVVYDLSDKFHLIYNILCNNSNAFIEIDSLDICGYETSYPIIDFSEIFFGINGCVNNKPGLRNSGQNTAVTYSHTWIPILCIHHHKRHTMGEGFIRQAPNEIGILRDTINPMLIGEEVVPDVRLF